jgi:hypothetical protein
MIAMRTMFEIDNNILNELVMSDLSVDRLVRVLDEYDPRFPQVVIGLSILLSMGNGTDKRAK